MSDKERLIQALLFLQDYENYSTIITYENEERQVLDEEQIIELINILGG